MATRLYANTTAPAYNPPTIRGSWDVTSSITTGKLFYKSASSSTIIKSETSSTNNYDILFSKWVSEPIIEAITLDGTLQWLIGVVEDNADANSFIHIHAYVTSGDSDTPRGTLLSDSIGASEFPVGTLSSVVTVTEGAKTLNSVAVQPGDRIVIEVGAQLQNTHTTSRDVIISQGGTSNFTDATAGLVNTALNHYFEFSKDIKFYVKNDSFRDDFNDNSIDTANLLTFASGTTTSATLFETNQRIEITTRSPGQTFGTVRVTNSTQTTVRDMRDSYASVYILPGSIALSNLSAAFSIYRNFSNMYVGMLFESNSSSPTLKAQHTFDGTTTVLATTAYDATAMAYWRIRDLSGTTYYEYSSDGLRWIGLYNEPTPFSLLGVIPNINIVDSIGSTNTLNIVDNYNVIPSLDAVTLVDAISKALNKGVADSSSLADDRTRQVQSARSDSVSPTDNLTRSGAFVRSLADTAAANDGAWRRPTKRPADSVTTTDNLTRLFLGALVLGEGVVASDQLTKSLIHRNADSALVLDSFTSLLLTVLNLADSVSTSDSIAKAARGSRSDSITSADQRTVSMAKSLMESVSAGDIVSYQSMLVRDVIQALDLIRVYLNGIPLVMPIESHKTPKVRNGDNDSQLDARRAHPRFEVPTGIASVDLSIDADAPLDADGPYDAGYGLKSALIKTPSAKRALPRLTVGKRMVI